MNQEKFLEKTEGKKVDKNEEKSQEMEKQIINKN